MEPPPNSKGEELDGKFSDSFQIGFNAYVFVFDFGMNLATENVRAHTRIVTSAVAAKEFCDMLTESLRDYVSRYGALKKDLRV